MMNERSARERYLRQTIFPGIGPGGQEKLLASRVVIVGCGANGSVMANTLVRAAWERSSCGPGLCRAPQSAASDAVRRGGRGPGTPKAAAAAAKLRRINSSIRIEEL